MLEELEAPSSWWASHSLPKICGCVKNKARRSQVPTIVNINRSDTNSLKAFPTTDKARR